MKQSVMPYRVYLKDQVHVFLRTNQHGVDGDWLDPKIEQWLQSHVQGKWKLCVVSQDTDEILEEVEEGFWPSTLSVLTFTDCNDAFAFKMQWC